MTEPQKMALEAALTGRLRLYPRGYAASKSGPFHSRQCVLALTRLGLMKVSTTMRFATATKYAREIHAERQAEGREQAAPPRTTLRDGGSLDGHTPPDDQRCLDGAACD